MPSSTARSGVSATHPRMAASLLRFAALFLLLLVPLVLSAARPQQAAAVDPPTLTTDKADYAPEETVHMSGTGFVARSCVRHPGHPPRRFHHQG